MTVDLDSQSVTAPDGATHAFEIDPVYRERLLKGLDDVALVLQYLPQIEAFEQRHYGNMPWLP
jgi:3-isopropylmalate/(R)-2-methylmalate dehydratase small subunit